MIAALLLLLTLSTTAVYGVLMLSLRLKWLRMDSRAHADEIEKLHAEMAKMRKGIAMSLTALQQSNEATVMALARRLINESQRDDGGMVQ